MGMTSHFPGSTDSDVNLEELDDALHDTFAPKEKKDKDEKKDDDDENKEESSGAPETPVVENEMTLTE
jgi:hypothetical protein